MNIVTYFDEGPGTDLIKELASDIVQSAAERVGINHNNLDKIAIAYPENYGKAVQDITGDRYTSNHDYVGVGKSISKLKQGQLRHSIVFHSCIFEAILSELKSAGGEITQWGIENQCMYFVIPHELGHCKDHEERFIPSPKRSLDFSTGFDLEFIHQYYSEILIDEASACIFGDKYYSEKMINHRYSEERKTLNKSYNELRKKLQIYSGKDEEILKLAASTSEWIWMYQIQLAKHIVSSSYRVAKDFQLTQLADIFENTEDEHLYFLQALHLIIDNYPNIPKEAKETLIQSWRNFVKKAGFTFEKRKEGWHFYWN